MEKNPCRDCLCLGLCINKTITKIVRDCSLVNKYISAGNLKHEVLQERIIGVLILLRPGFYDREEIQDDSM